MASIGERLREERVRRGLTLEQVAELTKIHATMLEAIETENFDQLPGGFFARSFIRQYARVLGVDEEQFDSELKQLTGFQAPPIAPVDEDFRPDIGRGPVRGLRPSRTRSRQPLGALIAFLLIVAVCSAIYAFWERTRMAANAPAALRTQAARVPQQYPAAAVTPPGTQAPVQVASARQTAPPPAAAPVQTAAAAAPAAARSAPVQVDVRARGEVWLRVVSDGETKFEGTLMENDSRSFTGDKPLIIRFGRPAFIDVTWNGKPMGLLDPAGNPVSVEFSPETFRILKPAARPPDDVP